MVVIGKMGYAAYLSGISKGRTLTMYLCSAETKSQINPDEIGTDRPAMSCISFAALHGSMAKKFAADTPSLFVLRKLALFRQNSHRVRTLLRQFNYLFGLWPGP